ncbi:hydrogenase expression/formation protein HypE [Fulvivirga sedimenti]|uniref:Hydrogenase expression/formation protein HypE n=1 Tax=Fulvivirga sedimenti TaxID=2879465 RepID=A0A9X1L3E5_9BACT|nr:hydrogenase expression/formation protein HypE [Fulvivirga sedimenti]MCA6079201.1 hydrogenase expression/formation protein HypE [Fulvivirga sedimenti]
MINGFTLSCPMPPLDFDVITLGHGSGGALTNQLLDSGVFTLLDNEFLHSRHDGAILDLSGKTAFTTDSFVISPIFFPGGNIGDLAVNGTINDLAMCGAKPRYISLGFILEEGLPVEELWEIIYTIKKATENAGVQVVTGDTKVVEKGKGDRIFVNTTGIGTVHPGAEIDAGRVTEGDAVIVSGTIANHGIAIMSQREGLSFETEVQSDTRSLASIIMKLLDEFGPEIHLLRDPTRGGVATVLNEIARQAKVGIEINENNIPIVPQVHGACEMLGLEPLYVANEGIFVGFVDAAHATDVVELLHGLPGSEDACIIGRVVDQHAGQVVMQSAIGGRRIIQMLPGEQLPRIC